MIDRGIYTVVEVRSGMVCGQYGSPESDIMQCYRLVIPLYRNDDFLTPDRCGNYAGILSTGSNTHSNINSWLER